MAQIDWQVFDQAELQHVANPGQPRGNRCLATQDLTAAEAIKTWPGYDPTPLVALSGLAAELGLKQLWYKDEAERFGLGSFKALGGAYAIQRLMAQRESDAPLTVATATDGNHGRSVAWGARNFGARAIIYIHAEVSAGREAALEEQGAEVRRIEGNYDDSVRLCAEEAEREGWQVVSDTSWPGYRTIPGDIMAGYSVMAGEIVQQLAGEQPSHVLVQGGVGGLAAAVFESFDEAWGAEAPRFIIVEPELAACLYASAKAGEPAAVEIEEETLMAGLSCGEVSLLAWEPLSWGTADFLTMPESLVVPSMTLLARSPFGDAPVVAGESAVAGLAATLAACRQEALKSALGLDADSRVLVIGTEGATDPAIYQDLVGLAPEAVTAG